jgi:integrase
MMDLISHLRTFKPDARPATLASYASTLRLLHQACKGTKDMPDLTWLRDYDKVVTALDSRSLSDGTRARYLTSCLVGLQSCEEACRESPVYKRYEEQRDSLEAQGREQCAQRDVNAREHDAWISVDRIHAMLRQQETDLGAVLSDESARVRCTGNTPLELHMMLALTVKYPSRLDLAGLLLCAPGQATDEETNYLELGAVLRIRINRWKTKRTAGDVRTIVPDAKTQRLLRAYLRCTGKGEGNWLFTSCRGGPLSRAAMGQRITAAFLRRTGKRVCMTVMRKVLLTGEHGAALEAMETSAHVHGHSLAMQRQRYIKRGAPKS